jgi:hypothetical protein
MVCFRYIIVNTLHRGDTKDGDDDVDDDDNNNNNNNNNKAISHPSLLAFSVVLAGVQTVFSWGLGGGRELTLRLYVIDVLC